MQNACIGQQFWDPSERGRSEDAWLTGVPVEDEITERIPRGSRELMTHSVALGLLQLTNDLIHLTSLHEGARKLNHLNFFVPHL